MNQELTENQRSVSKKYLLYEVLTNFWFGSAVWLYFYRLFITDQQVGILDGFAFGVGLLAEIPSGALADRFGRSRIMKIGQVLVAGGFITHGLGSTYSIFFLGQIMITVGSAFISGADDALFFERLGFDKATTQWRKLVTRGTQFSLIATLFATIAGGWLFGINPRLTWFLTGGFFLISVAVVWSLKDERAEKTTKRLTQEVRTYLQTIKNGFKAFYFPQLKLYIPIIVVVQGLFYAVGPGILRPLLLDRFHFSPFGGAIVLAVGNLLAVGILTYLHKKAHSVSERHVIIIVSLLAAASLVLSLGNIGWWGAIVIFALYSGRHILRPFMSEIINHRTDEQHRATVLSVASFMQAAPYVVLGPIIGYLSTQGNLKYFFVVWAALTLVSVLTYLSLRRKDEKIDFTKEELPKEPLPEITEK
jgi:MFS family permease